MTNEGETVYNGVIKEIASSYIDNILERVQLNSIFSNGFLWESNASNGKQKGKNSSAVFGNTSPSPSRINLYWSL